KKPANQGKPVATLVVDTNPFVKGLPLDHVATKFVTVPEVVDELRSRAAKERFQNLDLKHGIELVNPDAESIQAVVSFAKKTGDFASLALADLKIIALAFMLEKKANGMRRLRLEPVGNQPNIADRNLLASAEIADDHSQSQEEIGGLEESMQDLSIESKDVETPSKAVAGPKQAKKAPRKDNFFDGEWITPQNVKVHQAASAMGMKSAHADKPKSVLKVACVTSDFAMQNVILKMGINLVTPDGVSIRRLRTWVLRCHSCFTLTGDMNRQFCSACGHPTLKRCSVTTSSNGTLQVHLKSNYQYNLRGTKFAMPKPHGGQHTTHDIITRGDEKAYVSAMRYKTRVEAKTNASLSGANSLMDPDYIPDLLLGNVLANSNGYGIATDARGMPMVARNRKNPNAVR
ncbi:hypothetical protein GQ54DRAFT_240943, partial [Martensiomyces pterosporus]